MSRYGAMRSTVRGMLRNPGFVSLAVLALGLGIGANTTLFSVLDATVLQPLPFRSPDRLVALSERAPETGRPNEVAAPSFLDLEATATSASIAAWYPRRQALTGFGMPREVSGVRVSPALFAILGVQPQLGRGFSDTDTRQAAGRVVVISHGAWQTLFGGDPNALGRVMTLDGQSHEVVGIMPPGFRFPDRDEIAYWSPLVFARHELAHRGKRMFHVIGRLSPGVTLEQARAEFDGLARRLGEEYPDTNAGWGLSLVPARKALMHAHRQLPLLVGVVGVVLLLACANVSNLVLTRATERHRELALRAALGAGRRTLVAQLLAESLALCVAGGALGLLIAAWGVDFVLTLDPDAVSGWNPPTIDLRVLGFTVLLTLLTTLAAGALPALQASRLELSEALKQSTGAVSADPRPTRLRQLLVVAQIAMAMVLLTGTGLLVNSLVRLRAVQPGFDPHDVLAVSLQLPGARYTADNEEIRFFDALLEGLRTLPGVDAAGAVTTLPMNPVGIDYDLDFSILDRPPGEAAADRSTDLRLIAGDYFSVMRIPLLSGREPDVRRGAFDEVVINQSMARLHFSGRDPLGRRISFGGDSPPLRVVGVVGDVRHRGLDTAPRPEVFVPYQWMPHGALTVVLRSNREPSTLAEAVRREVLALDPDLPVTEIRTASGLLGSWIAPRENGLIAVTAFALLGVLLTAIGTYGVVSHSVVRRTREIGLRLAVGARRRDVLGMILRQGLLLTAAGLTLGAAGAVALSRLFAHWLYGVSPTDPLTFFGVAALLLAVVLTATWIPARRAARVEPMAALRYE